MLYLLHLYGTKKHIENFHTAEDDSLLRSKFGIGTEDIKKPAAVTKNPYAIYKQVLPKFYYYTLYDINQDGTKELIIGYGGSMAMSFFSIKDQKLISYKDKGEVNNVYGLYEKNNNLYAVKSILEGNKGDYVISEISLMRIGEKNGTITTECLYQGDYCDKYMQYNPLSVAGVENILNGAREIEIKSTSDYSLLEEAKDVRVFLNGKELLFTQPPVLESGNTLVPMRAVFEALGADVSYDAQSKKITAEKQGMKAVMWIGQSTAYVDNAFKRLPVEVINKNGSAMVPLRFVSEAFGADVDWDAENKIVTIRM